MGSVIEVRELSVHYGQRLAVNNLSLRIEPGELVALLGPNGAGKSTALLAMAGALPASSGSIAIGEVDIGAAPLEARRHIGFCDQPPTLYEFLTVSEHLAFVGEARGEPDANAHNQLLARLGLGGIGDRICRELSFGMRQRVGLAAALVGGVDVVLLDETLNGLDPRAARAARDVLREASEGGTSVLMSTHLLGVAERLCTRILIMDRGELRVDVSGAELENLLAGGAGAIEELYLTHVTAPEQGAA